ncbi:MAG TPA: VOC family protein [Steroidobacteraceae bacterium]
MTEANIGLISPIFLVRNTPASLAFYRDQLGFSVTHQDDPESPVFGIVQRGGAMLMFKDVGVPAMPNLQRHEWARWDAYLYVPDPDAMAAEFSARQVEFSAPLKDSPDGLRGFELRDLDGYVLFFGRPQPSTN